MIKSILCSVLLVFLVLPCILTMPPGEQKGRCKIEKRVRIALKTLNRDSVVEVANCIVGEGECDAVGSEVKSKMQEVMCSPPCSRSAHCTCEQIQVSYYDLLKNFSILSHTNFCRFV